VTGLLFLPCLFLAPLVAMVPGFSTAAILICVGLMMGKNIFSLKTEDIEEWVPALATLFLIPLTFSITKGLMWGLALNFLLSLMVGKREKLSWMNWGLGLLSLGYLGWNT
jgi:AGZA family xanthine/uracil permease-like MFS transporter